MSKDEDEVRKASENVYTAMNRMINGDTSGVAKVWSHAADVTAMHPIGGRVVGWDAVRESFEKVAGIASDGRVKLEERMVRVTGDLAYEVGMERGHAKLAGKPVEIDIRVTNIYRREGGEWKVVHHHTDLSPAMIEAVRQVPARA